MRRVFYWVPKTAHGAPDEVTLRTFESLCGRRSRDPEVLPFSSATELQDLARTHGTALVHFGKTPVVSLSDRSRALAVALWKRMPVSTHIHGRIDVEFRSLLACRPIAATQLIPTLALLRHVLKRHQLAIVNSNAMLEYVRDLGFDGRVAVVPNAIDTKFWSTRGSSTTRDPYIFSHGRLSREKGYDLLLRAVALSPTPPRVVIAGTGPMEHELTRLANDLAVSLDLVGWQSATQIRDYLNQCALAVYPSRFEGFSLAALEGLYAAPRVLISTAAGVLDHLSVEMVQAVAVKPAVDSLATAINRSRAPKPQLGLHAFAYESVAETIASTLCESIR